MQDLEQWITRVRSIDVRPLVREAYRAYAAGAARATIVLTWTAVCADLIDKVRALHEGGEPQATPLIEQVDQAQGNLDAKAIRTMQAVESSLLDQAVALELIDATQKIQLERLREDRNLCAHPSLRPMGELFDPPLEYARTHLVVALEAVLVQPASQGRKVVSSFAAHVLDPAFVGDPNHIASAFFRRVRPAARRRVVEFAARHALLEPALDDANIDAAALADRMATRLRIFASEDRILVSELVRKFTDRLSASTVPIQSRALARLGDLDAFWSGIDESLRSQLDTIVRTIGAQHAQLEYWQPPKLEPTSAQIMSFVSIEEVRATLPSLEPAFAGIDYHRRATVIEYRPSPYFAGFLAGILADVGNFDNGALAAHAAVLPCAQYVTLEQLRDILSAWEANNQCWGRYMVDYAARFYLATVHLGGARNAVWHDFLDRLARREDGIVDYQAVHKALEDRIGSLLRAA
ncbi:hypothetical protein AB0E88_12325 [Streptomyces sp. NPDC028635]|uniref:hypothetical protein n=1 Tax=Streptomyces sp. NPDC028635 TaxID=3154800 RepID=UPI0033EFBEBC